MLNLLFLSFFIKKYDPGESLFELFLIEFVF